MILVTGGAGFIGSNFVLQWLADQEEPVVNLDKLTYAGNRRNLEGAAGDPRHIFLQGDICNERLVAEILLTWHPRAVINFAAETHVDRSIMGPGEFVRTNILGTFTLLDAARAYWDGLDDNGKKRFRFLQVSTDEVYGSLGPGAAPFRETTAYAPNSPYAASQAAADHLVRSYYRTYGLPTLTTNSSNNYGPLQFPEKLIPMVITRAIAGDPIPVYGDGLNVRDWIFVMDHCLALCAVLERGRPGETYNIGASCEKTNLEVVHMICKALDELRPAAMTHARLISFVKDRPGHDRRYAIDSRKIELETEWRPALDFDDGIRETVKWYLKH